KSCSRPGPTAAAATTPSGKVAQMNTKRVPANRKLSFSGSNCQTYAANKNVAGMVMKLAKIAGNSFSTNGASTSADKKPRTTLGRLAINSIVGLMTARVRGFKNSLV